MSLRLPAKEGSEAVQLAFENTIWSWSQLLASLLVGGSCLSFTCLCARTKSLGSVELIAKNIRKCFIG